MDTPKRIKVIELLYRFGDGGIEALLRDYARMIDRDKIELVILAPYIDLQSANAKRVQDIGIRIVPLRRHFRYTLPNRIWNRLTRDFAFSRCLKRFMREEDPDILHVHMPQLLPCVQQISQDLKDVRLYFTCHCQPGEYFGDNETPGYFAGRYLIEHNGLRLIALHEDMARELNERFGVDDTIVIHNGIDLPAFQNVSESRQAIRESIGILQDAFVLGHVGRFTEAKNHMFLLEIFAAVRKVRPEAHLLLVGAGELEGQARARISEMGLEGDVTILSHRSDIPQLLKAMDVFVFPSLFEGLGIAFVEAQAAGLRCVVSDRVPEAACLTDKAVSLSLDQPLEVWRDTILDDTVRGTPHGRLEDYDMHREIKRLEALYLGEPGTAF